MALFFISLLVVAVVIAAMAIGVLTGRAPIKGSCGGMGALGLKDSCEICGGSAQRSEQDPRATAASDPERDSTLYYRASR